MIIALVGMAGAGKSIVADKLVEKGYSFLRFGQLTLDKVKEQGLPPTEENERAVREQLRKEHGMGAYATLNIPNIDKLKPVVIDGLYSWTEYKILKERYGKELIVIAVYAPPELRYERLTQRTTMDAQLRNRPMDKDRAIKRDYAEIEKIEKGGPIAMADFTLINTGDREHLYEQLNDIPCLHL